MVPLGDLPLNISAAPSGKLLAVTNNGQSAHRSLLFLAGGFLKQGYVDYTMYSTTSVLRTIELILDTPCPSPVHAAFVAAGEEAD